MRHKRDISTVTPNKDGAQMSSPVNRRKSPPPIDEERVMDGVIANVTSASGDLNAANIINALRRSGYKIIKGK
jgi:hypothetical protein